MSLRAVRKGGPKTCCILRRTLKAADVSPWLAAGAACVALLIAAAPAAGGHSAPAVPAHGGAVVFASDFGIYVANLDGTGVRRLTRSPTARVSNPVWSPDARRIAFGQSDSTGEWDVMVVNADGSGLRRVAYGLFPAWSPDGKLIAFTGTDFRVHVVTPAGLLLEWSARDGYGNFAWSPDGTRLAYPTSTRPWQLAVTNVRTGATRTLPAPVSANTSVAWSPDGGEIAVVDNGLELVDPASGKVVKLNHTGWAPQWSPDGSRLAFVTCCGPTGDLFTIRRDGTGFRRLASLGPDWACDSASYHAVAWSGDGNTLVYSKCRYSGSEGSDLWRVRRDGTAARPITHAFPTGASFVAPEWASTTISPPAGAPQSTVSLRSAHSATLPQAIFDLAADGDRAAVQTLSTDDIDAVAVWDTTTGTVTNVGGECDNAYPDLAVAGTQTAWTCVNGETGAETDLLAAADDSQETLVATANGDDERVGHLVGDGSLLVFDTWFQDPSGTVIGPALSQVVDGPPPAAREIVAGDDTYRVLAVDAGRIGVLRSDGTFVILNAQGTRLSAFELGDHVSGARLTGPRLVVLRGTTLEVRDATTGRIEHRWPTAASAAPITLEDADGDLAAYTAGIAIHLLRLSNGHDRVLRIPGEAQPADAELEPGGLYYSYNETGSARPGRLAFVPAAELRSKLP